MACLADEGCAQVWVKMEAANPTGSYKDRMALAMIEAAGARYVGGGFLAPVVFDGLADQLACSAAFACQVCDFRTIERGIGWVSRIV